MVRGVRRDKAVEVGGLEASTWIAMYEHTHNGFERIEWPDGGCYMKQEHLLVEVFDLVRVELRAYRDELQKAQKR